MKNIANRLFLFAAAALSLGTAAYGQDTMRANVPFAFAVRGIAGASAGHYTVRFENIGAGPIAQIRDSVTGKGVVSLAIRLDGKAGAAIAPHLVFLCAEAGCQLSEIWTRTEGFRIPVKHVRESEYVASIPLVTAGD
jgi:hypothetical protein